MQNRRQQTQVEGGAEGKGRAEEGGWGGQRVR
jgi:hypothetical protein